MNIIDILEKQLRLQDIWTYVFTRGQIWSRLWISKFFCTKIIQHTNSAMNKETLPSGWIIRLTPFFFNHLFVIIRCISYKPL